jgi:hypothetical protein
VAGAAAREAHGVAALAGSGDDRGAAARPAEVTWVLLILALLLTAAIFLALRK